MISIAKLCGSLKFFYVMDAQKDERVRKSMQLIHFYIDVTTWKQYSNVVLRQLTFFHYSLSLDCQQHQHANDNCSGGFPP